MHVTRRRSATSRISMLTWGIGSAAKRWPASCPFVLVGRGEDYPPAAEGNVFRSQLGRELAGDLGAQVGVDRGPQVAFEIGVHAGEGVRHWEWLARGARAVTSCLKG